MIRCMWRASSTCSLRRARVEYDFFVHPGAQKTFQSASGYVVCRSSLSILHGLHETSARETQISFSCSASVTAAAASRPEKVSLLLFSIPTALAFSLALLANNSFHPILLSLLTLESPLPAPPRLTVSSKPKHILYTQLFCGSPSQDKCLRH